MRAWLYLVCVAYYAALLGLGLMWLLFLIPGRAFELAWTAVESKFNLHLEQHPELQEDRHDDW